MRRKDKQVTDPAVIGGLFKSGRVCRLAMVDEGEPYVVPVNYGYADNGLYFHSAAVGRKIDILARHSRVCFEIESPVEIVAHAEPCQWGARARSLVGYGVAKILTDAHDKRHGLDIIMQHHGKLDSAVYIRSSSTLW